LASGTARQARATRPGGGDRYDDEETIVSILTIILVIIAVGVLLWLVNRFIPMQGTVRSILNAVVIILLVVWLLDVFGLIDVLRDTDVRDIRT
jgi:hypothetical protein